MIQKYFGMACRQQREQKKLSQEKFALMIGMDRTYYSSVEAGKRNISIQNIKKIADGFGIAISELLNEAEKFEAIANKD
ncbi:DNA-binding transcriptional regulator, XRE-family HTH domain [Butyrivibrio sp. Su6]|uniref:helix-turn-helix domain-containing protein n=1 Tax=Butyrivibrio sp. Su6 TaxID=1520810 RepID=UPI00089E296B|nr:helix-turn-helix transcriptional regulator [Butyrivibrio sp. Su6]SEF61955.1 DNA-binding transcriptional regulator, XRE-family HTH domain [Butyrivibrio sp. Su6]